MLLAFAPPDSAAAPQQRVLVLYAGRRDAQISIVGDREIPKILRAELPNVDYYAEYVDLQRFRNTEYERALHDFLSAKYTGLKFDLIIAMGDDMLTLVAQNRTDLFRDVPVVFFTANPNTRAIASSTGIRAPTNLRDTVAFALEMQPDLEQVFVVSGAEAGDRAMADGARAQLKSFESRLRVTYLSGLRADALEATVSTLPPHSIVYFLLVSEDGAGERFHPLEYVGRIASVANAPTYSWVDSTIGHGVVGGSLKDQTLETQALGGLAVRVLQGERADSIPVSTAALNVREVDWRELERWGIPDSRVPPDTRVLFRTPGLWSRYKQYVIVLAAVLAAQGILIAALLFQRSRRRRAELRLRASEAELRVGYQRLRDLGNRLMGAQEAEQSRVARELHDDINQQVAMLCIDLDRISRDAPADAPDDGALARKAGTRAQQISRSIHDLSHSLHPSKLHYVGLAAAIASLARDCSRPDLSIAVAHADVPSTLPQDLMVCLYRIAQEALTNAVKHSHAHQVSLDLTGTADRLAPTIVDDGVGCEAAGAWGKGLGLISMNERVEYAGGTLTFQSRPGAGTRLEVSIPVTSFRTH